MPYNLIRTHSYFGKAIWRHTTTSLLARYTLPRRPARRLQADLLGGVALEHERYTCAYQYTTLDSTQAVHSTSAYDSRYKYSLWLFTAGLSTRYRVGQHLEAVLDATLNARPGSWASPPTLAGALGRRYRFGH